MLVGKYAYCKSRANSEMHYIETINYLNMVEQNDLELCFILTHIVFPLRPVCYKPSFRKISQIAKWMKKKA